VSPEPIELSAALNQAIDTLDHKQLRTWVKHYCKSIEPLGTKLENHLLILGKDVVRYHIDTDSEDDQGSVNESSEGDEDGENSDSGSAPGKKLEPIAATDDEMVPRYATCLNCGAQFDVSSNDRGDCRWHPGI
jgi:hypothetical protein